jgi:hypothetical protein
MNVSGTLKSLIAHWHLFSLICEDECSPMILE